MRRIVFKAAFKIVFKRHCEIVNTVSAAFREAISIENTCFQLVKSCTCLVSNLSDHMFSGTRPNSGNQYHPFDVLICDAKGNKISIL